MQRDGGGGGSGGLETRQKITARDIGDDFNIGLQSKRIVFFQIRLTIWLNCFANADDSVQ